MLIINMHEKELIKIIKEITQSEYIGDDCAYLKELGIVITQDSLAENVHFSLEYTNAYQLGWKSEMVNISDVCASGAVPAYLTVAISIPDYINVDFLKEFYKGIKDASGDVKIAGGDITASDKLYISVTAIGKTKDRKISSRSNAKSGYKVIVSEEHGNSAKGLRMLQNGYRNFDNKFIKSHLMPNANIVFSREIAKNTNCEYAMTDTSDGLADALMQIAKASNVLLDIDTSLIPHDKDVDTETALYGGEDYELVACIPESTLKYLSKYYVIGDVKDTKCGIQLDGIFFDNIDDKIFNHFKS